MNNISITKTNLPHDLADCRLIRRKVFIEEQNVPENRERDGLDDHCKHYIVKWDNIAVGTARVKYIEEYAKIERVAILASYRGKVLGVRLMHYIINDLREDKIITKATLNAQVTVIPFYEKLGFEVCSEEFVDADLAHRTMQILFSK